MTQKVDRAVVVVQRLEQIRIPVREVAKHTRMAVKIAEATVRAPTHADSVPKPSRAQVLVDHVRRTMQLVPSILIKVGSLSYVIHLSGHEQSLVDRIQPGIPSFCRNRLCRQRIQKHAHVLFRILQRLLIRSHVHEGALLLEQCTTDLIQVIYHPIPIILYPLNQTSDEVKILDSSHTFRNPACNTSLRIQSRSRHSVTTAKECRFKSSLRLQNHLLEPTFVI
mmetsp:Transcript_8735/g.31036  ORF Transcript_8735/g.31036 Transcript_8735/m.31036 type:complete len:223 (+) Transcript_8735:349-1017(+)